MKWSLTVVNKGAERAVDNEEEAIFYHYSIKSIFLVFSITDD